MTFSIGLVDTYADVKAYEPKTNFEVHVPIRSVAKMALSLRLCDVMSSPKGSWLIIISKTGEKWKLINLRVHFCLCNTAGGSLRLSSTNHLFDSYKCILVLSSRQISLFPTNTSVQHFDRCTHDASKFASYCSCLIRVLRLLTKAKKK